MGEGADSEKNGREEGDDWRRGKGKFAGSARDSVSS